MTDETGDKKGGRTLTLRGGGGLGGRGLDGLIDGLLRALGI